MQFYDNLMKCNLIGAGRLGKNIALTLLNSQAISELYIANRTMASAYKASQDLGYGVAVQNIRELPVADITWLCSNDDSLPQLVETLASYSKLKTGSFVIHSSGVLNSSLLAPLKAHGCFIASFHPLKAFKKNYLDAFALNQVDCVLEGDKEVCVWLDNLFTRAGAYVSEIKSENKARYHAAACMASNYLVTLAGCCEQIFLEAGISPQQSRRMLINLMQGNLTNLSSTRCFAEALTGPIERGDVKTLALHLNSFENPVHQRLYQAAGLATLPLTQLTKEQKKTINNVLTEVLSKGEPFTK